MQILLPHLKFYYSTKVELLLLLTCFHVFASSIITVFQQQQHESITHGTTSEATVLGNKKVSRNLAVEEGPEHPSTCVHVRRYFASEGQGREQAAGEGRKALSGQMFFLLLDSPGRAEQTHTRRSRCVRMCRVISAQPAGERSGTELLIAGQKLLDDSAHWHLLRLLTFTFMLHKQKHLHYRDILV